MTHLKFIQSLFIGFIIVSSSTVFAQRSCNDYLISAKSSQTLDFIDSLSRMNYLERVQKLEQEIYRLNFNLAPEQGIFRRTLFSEARKIHKANETQKNLIKKLQSELQKYKAIESTILEAKQKHFLSYEEEVRLLNRTLKNKEYARSLAVLNKHNLQEANRYEQDYVTSMIHYLVLGPDISFFTMPFHHWLIFNYTHGQQNSSYFSNVVENFHGSTVNDQALNSGLNEDSLSQELIQNDPIFRMVAETNSSEIKEALEQAMTDGVLSLDEYRDLVSDVEEHNQLEDKNDGENEGSSSDIDNGGSDNSSYSYDSGDSGDSGSSID